MSDVEVTGDPQAPGKTENFQGQFIDGIDDEVVGKSLDEISVDRVAGSSLTSGGFNQAVESIKEQACPPATRSMAVWRFEAIGTRWEIDTRDDLPPALRGEVAARSSRGSTASGRDSVDDSDADAPEPRRRILRGPGRRCDARRVPRALGGDRGSGPPQLVGASLDALGYSAGYSLTPGEPIAAPGDWTERLAWSAEDVTAAAPVLIDVGALGKGRLVDRVFHALSGVSGDLVVDAGGDLRMRGAPVRVGLEHPFDPARAIGIANSDGCGTVRLRDQPPRLGRRPAPRARRPHRPARAHLGGDLGDRVRGDDRGCRRHGALLRRRAAARGILGSRMGADDDRRSRRALARVPGRIVHGGPEAPRIGESGIVISSLTAARQRVLAVLGGISMYRLVLFSLLALGAIALVLSVLDRVAPDPLPLIASFLVLGVVISGVDFSAQRLLRLPWRVESSLVTAMILLFVLQPAREVNDVKTLGGLALAGAVASVSKYLIAWRGRHILNPAAFGAAFVTITGLGTFSAWWVGTPALAVPVLVLGLIVLWRTEKVRVVAVFLVIAVATSVLRQSVLAAQNALTFDVAQTLSMVLLQSPFLFLGAFMLSEPLTLPPRRWQQFSVAALVGLLAGWPIAIGTLFTLGQERALLIGNLLAFAFALRGSVRLTLEKREFITPTAQQLTFRAKGKLRFLPGQYLELDVPHRHPDARGTRREFSIVSAPGDLPTLRIAYKDGDQKHPSSYKRALAAAQPGATLAVTGTWGDFILPRGDAPVLMVAAGIGVTPFVSQLRQLQLSGRERDVVLVHVAAAQLAFRDELAATAAPAWSCHPRGRRTCPRTGRGRRACGWMPRASSAWCRTSRSATRSSPDRRVSSPTSPRRSRRRTVSRPTPSPATEAAAAAVRPPAAGASGCAP